MVNKLPDKNQDFYGLAQIAEYGGEIRSWSFNVADIPCVTLEGFLATNSHREKSGTVAITMNNEHLVNWIMTAIKYFYQERKSL